MREFTKSAFSLPWAMPLFGAQQLRNTLLPPPSGKATVAFSLLTPEAFNRNGGATAGLVQQSAEILRSLNPAQDAALTLQELRNKVHVFAPVRNIPTTLQLPDGLPSLVAHLQHTMSQGVSHA